MHAKQSFGNVGHQAQCKTAQRAVIISIDEHASFGFGIVEGAGLSPGDVVYGIDNAMGF
jgi:hypothetical protein